MQLSSEEIEKLREHKQRVIEYCSAYTEFGLLNQCNILKNAVNSIEFWSEETIIGEEVRDELKKITERLTRLAEDTIVLSNQIEILADNIEAINKNNNNE